MQHRPTEPLHNCRDGRGRLPCLSAQTHVVCQGVFVSLIRFAAMTLALAGLVLCCFSLAAPCRLAFTAGLVSFLGLARFRCLRTLQNALRFLEKNWICFLSLILLSGILVRIAAFLLFVPDSLAALQQGMDSEVFWNESAEMSTGKFPPSKSWTTILFYASAIRLLGPTLHSAIVFNWFAQSLTAFLLFVFAKRISGRSTWGLCAASLFLFSPGFVQLSFRVYSEHPYFLLLALALLAVESWSKTRRPFVSFQLALVSVAVLWTRSEGGLFLLLSVPTFFAADIMAFPMTRKRAFFSLVLFSICSLSLLVVGREVNQSLHGYDTVLCSYDSWWPRLFGSNVQSGGRVNKSDKPLILERYRKETGVELQLKPMNCPPELIPTIKSEISKRWNAFSPRELFRFVVCKESNVWRDCGGVFGRPLFHRLEQIYRTLLLVLAAWTLLRFILGLGHVHRQETTLKPLLLFFPIGLALTVALAVSVAESSNHYGLVAWALFPVYIVSLQQRFERNTFNP